MTKYMVAVDGSEHSSKAYDIAHKLVTNKDELIFVTVGQKGKASAGQELLDKWTKKAEVDGITAKSLFLESNDPRDALCSAVTEHSADILVVGTRGLGTLKRMLLGSVSNYCVQHAPCDVIVAK